MAFIRFLRTVVFYFLWTLSIGFWGVFIMLMVVLPFRLRHRIATGWGDTSVWLLRLICGVKWEVQGKENLPNEAVVFAVNHQSTWETVFGPMLCRDQVWVLKRELMWLPIFGWAMALLKPIAIDRNQRKHAMEQIIEQGEKRFAIGFSVVMFPEGHRFEPDAPLNYKLGAARLACASNRLLVPIVHNAGQFWPRRGLIHSGTIQVRIGKPFDPNGRKPNELNDSLQAWARATRDELIAAENARRQLLNQ